MGGARGLWVGAGPVSYTHLDVYKRQGLTYIYGIGRSAADEILAATKINPDTRVKDLTKDCLLYTSRCV